jgi:integrase
MAIPLSAAQARWRRRISRVMVIECRETTEYSVVIRRVPNHTLRSREYLTEDEVSDLIRAARSIGRNRLRDMMLILVSNRHGLRVSEAADLRWEQLELKRNAATSKTCGRIPYFLLDIKPYE